MHKDSIVEEIHAIRRELASECNNELKRIVERAMQRQRSKALQPMHRAVKPAESRQPIPR